MYCEFGKTLDQIVWILDRPLVFYYSLAVPMNWYRFAKIRIEYYNLIDDPICAYAVWMVCVCVSNKLQIEKKARRFWCDMN